jgi:Rod binding domain-containing protein
MDIIKMPLIEAVPQISQLRNVNEVKDGSDEVKKQFARDFESVFINKILDQMSKTVGEWGFEKDGASKQIQGVFNMLLSRDIANKGGFGFWKQIYESLKNTPQETTSQGADSKI